MISPFVNVGVNTTRVLPSLKPSSFFLASTNKHTVFIPVGVKLARWYVISTSESSAELAIMVIGLTLSSSLVVVVIPFL